ncbi:ead/Ea22-like family protein [Klebsiella sp. Kpp]|uniref:ead/Ea22-like family protein n=1 Tax=Klebsiella sp. Kpp TaxID=2758578 RepID=UPI001643D047|nr:ead/Ea22-like family protein [Klebsiella sp. Kpp]MBC3627057.1 ead/Ea22-like family protein [Klebsiella sp. Kpp]
MTDITELAQQLKAAAEKATPGEWWADEVKNEGCYGSGDDCVEGFTSYAIYGSDGQTLFDSLNSDAACICEEYDGEGHVAWDETAQRNAEFIALANPANILALVETLEKAQQVDEELCKLLPPGAEYMDPPDGGDVTPLEGVRRMVADYRQRIAELREWNAGLAQESFERQQRISELLEGKVGNALLERENHHVEVVGKLTEHIDQLESRTVTVKLPNQTEFDDPLSAYEAIEKCKDALAAAGIKVEAE